MHQEATDPPIPERSRHIDLTRWYGWAEQSEGNRAERALADLDAWARSAGEILREIDPEFDVELDQQSETVASDRLRRLLRAWTRPSVPVLETGVESPLDVLEVFTRINLGGVQVGGADVYLAAVKDVLERGRITTRPGQRGHGSDP